MLFEFNAEPFVGRTVSTRAEPLDDFAGESLQFRDSRKVGWGDEVKNPHA